MGVGRRGSRFLVCWAPGPHFGHSAATSDKSPGRPAGRSTSWRTSNALHRIARARASTRLPTRPSTPGERTPRCQAASPQHSTWPTFTPCAWTGRRTSSSSSSTESSLGTSTAVPVRPTTTGRSLSRTMRFSIWPSEGMRLGLRRRLTTPILSRTPSTTSQSKRCHRHPLCRHGHHLRRQRRRGRSTVARPRAHPQCGTRRRPMLSV
mmetsp:Transcript_17887/g.44725  ORF Transcript_17887/g.44725 Transcript_17887/m.44725 type:complete len:207 (+) Transcript_17887:192-812(+)